MLIEIELPRTVSRSIETLRINHIDALTLIKEKLNQILPQHIEEIIKCIYDNMEGYDNEQ